MIKTSKNPKSVVSYFCNAAKMHLQISGFIFMLFVFIPTAFSAYTSQQNIGINTYKVHNNGIHSTIVNQNLPAQTIHTIGDALISGAENITVKNSEKVEIPKEKITVLEGTIVYNQENINVYILVEKKATSENNLPKKQLIAHQPQKEHKVIPKNDKPKNTDWKFANSPSDKNFSWDFSYRNNAVINTIPTKIMAFPESFKKNILLYFNKQEFFAEENIFLQQQFSKTHPIRPPPSVTQ